MERRLLDQLLQRVRKWNWLRQLAHWYLNDPIRVLKQEPWWDIVERHVRYYESMAWPAHQKHKVLKENVLLEYARLGIWPPKERDVNIAIELILRGW